MAIIFNDGNGNPLVQKSAELNKYLQQAKSKIGGNLNIDNSSYILFGQKGNKVFDPNNPNDWSSFVALQVLDSSYTIEGQLLSSSKAPKGNTGLNSTTYKNTRGGMEDVLSNYKLLFLYDYFNNDATGLSITNEFSSPVESTINQFLDSPIIQGLGTLGSTGVLDSVLNPIASKLGMKGQDLFSMIFLSRIKTVKIWQGGNITFELPVSLTFVDYNHDPFNNVLLPVYLLYIIQGYHRIPFNMDSSSSNWIQKLNSIITMTIGPMYFTLNLGNFLKTDRNNMLAITKMDAKFLYPIKGIPTVAKVNLTMSNINPIVLEDVPAIGGSKDTVQFDINSSFPTPEKSKKVYNVNNSK